MGQIELQARQLNDFGDPLLREAVQNSEFDDASMREGMAYEQREKEAMEIEVEGRDFVKSLINLFERVRVRAEELRDDEVKNTKLKISTYKDLYDLETVRAENRVRDSYGDPTADDGHADVGITMGWTSQGVKYMRAKLFDRYYNAFERPYRPVMIGNKDEAKELEKVVVNVMDDQLRRCDFGQAVINLFNNAATYGTGYLRCEFERRLTCKKDETGGYYYEELDETVAPRLTVLNNMDVLVADWEISESEDQELIFYITPNTSLPYLEDQEAVFDLRVDQGVFQPIGTVRKSGKFTNLFGLRRAAFEKVSYGGERSNELSRNQSDERTIQKATTFPELTVIEPIGRVNMAPFVYDGQLTPKIAEFYLGVKLDRQYDMDNDADKYEFAMAMSKRRWHFAYAIDAPSATVPSGKESESGTSRYLLRMDDGLVSMSRNDLFKVVCHRGAKNQFMGISINRMIRPMEDAADYLMNKITWAQAQNANPNWIYFQDMLVDGKNADKISQLWTGMGNGFAAKRHGGPGESLDPNKIAVPLLHTVDAERAYTLIDRLKNEAEMTSAVTLASKTGMDATGSATATGAQISQAKVDLQDGLIVGGIVRELNHKLFPYILEGVTKAMGAKFVDYALRISGSDATNDLATKLLSKDGWWNEFRFDHPTVKGLDPAVISQSLVALHTQLPGEFDPAEVARVAAEAILVRPGTVLAHKMQSQEPELKVKLLLEGNYVSVLPGDNDMACIMALTTLAQDIQAQAAVPPGDPMITLNEIGRLIAQHQAQMMMKQQMAAAQAAMGVVAGPPGGGMAMGANDGSAPKSSAEMSGDMQGQANMVPGGANANGAF